MASVVPSGSTACIISSSGTSLTGRRGKRGMETPNSKHCAAAIDTDHLARDECSFGTGEVRDHGSDLFHLCGPAEGNDADEFLRQGRIILDYSLHLWRVDSAGGDTIDCDVVAGEFTRQSSSERVHTAFGGIIGGVVPEPIAHRIGTKIDDAAPFPRAH